METIKKRRLTPDGLAAGIIISTLALVAIAPAVMAAPTVVTNSSLEQTTAGRPTCFEQAGYGNSVSTWVMTTDAHSGAAAQSLTISNYVDGNYKLMMAENADCAPAVVAGNTYELSAWYKSTSAKNSLTIFRHSNAGWTYWTDAAALPAAADWTQANVTTPVVPEGTDQLSFGISLAGNGTLITDDYAIAQTAAPAPVPAPAPTDPNQNPELTRNPGLENGANPPADWMLAGWGDAKVTSGVTADAHSGNRAYRITLNERTQGDYKLLPADAAAVAVQPGVKYELSAWYKSTTDKNSITAFAHTANGWAYWTELKTLPVSAGWTKTTVQTPAIPAGIDAISWGVTIYGNGTLTTDDYSTTRFADAPLPPPAGDPAAQGKWTVLDYKLPVRGVHSTLLKNGKILLIAGSGNNVDDFQAGTFKASVWDPLNGTFIALKTPKDMFCAGHVTLPDGRVLIQGGTKSYPTPGGADFGGLKDSWIFNPDTNVFAPAGMANEGHWYPTLTALGNGDVWMAGGLKEDATGSVNTEHFDFANKKWLATDQVKQTYSFWGLYPHMFLMQDGRMFYSGAHVFGNALPGTGASIYNRTTGTIADVKGLRVKDLRDQASSVLLPPAQDQKVLITGGGNITTDALANNLTDIIDLKQAIPAYKPGPDLPGKGKMYLNATTLPDRTVLATNGGQLNRDDSTNVLTAASYNPATNAWTTIAADPIGRNYHSSSVLLPDGRVVVLGSNPGDGSFELRISVYQPNYLFKTARPVISYVPATATYGKQYYFRVNTTGKAIKWAQLTRPMSVTHQMDSNMRLVDLPVTVQNGYAIVTVPANRNLLPPGPYMLTVTDTDGVPSKASWINIR